MRKYNCLMELHKVKFKRQLRDKYLYNIKMSYIYFLKINLAIRGFFVFP